MASQYIQQQIEIDRPANAAAVSVVLLRDLVRRRCSCCGCRRAGRQRREEQAAVKLSPHGPAHAARRSRSPTCSSWSSCRSVVILWRTFDAGHRRVLRVDHARPRRSRRCNCRCSSSRSSCRSTSSSACHRARAGARQVPRPGLLQAVVDLPFAVSPIVVGVSLILLWGVDGWFGGRRDDLGFKVIFGLPGMVLATHLRHAAVRRPRGRAGAARDRHRPGAGGRHAGRVRGGRRSGGSPCRRSAGA